MFTRLNGNMNKRSLTFVAIVLILFLAVLPALASAAVVEPDRDTQLVMGDLYALSVAMRLYRDGAHRTNSRASTPPCPTIDQLARYFKTPLPARWLEDYRTAAVGNAWWVGRKVPEFSRARKFLRENAPWLGLYDKESMSAWLGASYVWVAAASFGKSGGVPDVRVALGEDGQRLFFNSPDTEYYWWSDLLYTPDTRAAVLKKFGDLKAGPFVVPPVPSKTPETFSASPVSPPSDFTLESEEDSGARIGDVIFNPLPRGRD